MARHEIAQRRADEPSSEMAGHAAILSLVEPSPAGARARKLFAEARAISLEHLAETSAAMADLQSLLQTIGEAGDLYVPGVQAFAARLAEDLFWRAKSFELLIEQQRAAVEPAPVRARR